MKNPLIQQNLLDKAIAYVSPKLAQQRLASRAQLALAGGYSGARMDRAALARWNPGAGSATADIITDLPMLRSRSRDQMRNAPVAVGAINTACSHVVGTGMSLTPSVNAEFLGLSDDEAQAWNADTALRFHTWANSQDADSARQLNFYGLQDLALRTVLESGDAFVVTPRLVRNGAAKLALQLLEADRVSNPARAADSDTVIDGVEVDPATMEALAYHVSNRHPGDVRTTGQLTWQRIAARGANTGRRNVLHLFKPLRPGQVRGVPWIAPILEPLKQLNRYTDAELKAAVDSAIFSVFVKMDHTAFEQVFDTDAQGAIVQNAGKWTGELESGKAINLLPGESIETNTPGRPNPQFDPFIMSILRQIGMALELPYEVLVMHYQSSYSAARAALLMAWKFFRSRRDWLATNLCQPVYELWLADEIAEGRISAPGYFQDDVVKAAWLSAMWTGDGPGSIDPQKEVAAAQERVDMGISTLESESINFDGIGWAQKHKQRVREVHARREDEIETDSATVRLNADPGTPDTTTQSLLSTLEAVASQPQPTIVLPQPKPHAIKVTPVRDAEGVILHTIQEPL